MSAIAKIHSLKEQISETKNLQVKQELQEQLLKLTAKLDKKKIKLKGGLDR